MNDWYWFGMSAPTVHSALREASAIHSAGAALTAGRTLSPKVTGTSSRAQRHEPEHDRCDGLPVRLRHAHAVTIADAPTAGGPPTPPGPTARGQGPGPAGAPH